MNITKSRLRRIIQEELQNVLNEATDASGVSSGGSREFNPNSRRDINAAHRRYQRTGGVSGISKADWRKARRALARGGGRRQTRQQSMPRGHAPQTGLPTALTAAAADSPALANVMSSDTSGLQGKMDRAMRTTEPTTPPAPTPTPAATTPPAPTPAQTKTLADRHRAHQARRNAPAAPATGSTKDWLARLRRFKSQQGSSPTASRE